MDTSRGTGILLPSTVGQEGSAFNNLATFVEWVRCGRRIPGIVQWEILSACNFRCPFCYIVGHVPTRVFSAARMFEIVQEFVASEVVQVILTGGEPLLHPGFHQLYRELKKAGILVTVFSNLSQFSDKHFELFRELPPSGVEVSIYGHDEESYYSATGRRCFKDVLRNVELLVSLGIDVLCKTPVTTTTASSIQWIREWCDERSLPYVASPNIEDGLDGVSLKHFAVSVPRIHQIQARRFAEASLGVSSRPRDPRVAFGCGVGKIGAYIGYDGTVSPCASTRNISFL
ncbi:MAG: radical SAM protein [Gemmatimonadetes bacterium]|nr:radical SAM protein [Gemmatimonadota bacterium]